MDELLTAHTPDCTLLVQVAYQPGATLRVRYEVLNHSTLPLFLCNQLYKGTESADAAEPTVRPHPDLVHIQVEPRGVQVTKAITDLSFHDGIRALDIPYLSEVPPGQTFAQEIEVAVPMQPYRTYGKRPGPAPAIALPLWFALGYLRGTPELLADLQPVSTGQPGTYEVPSIWSRQQVLITAGPSTGVVPVANALPGVPPPPVPPEQWTPWS